MPCVEFNHRSLEGSGHEQNRKNFQTDFQSPTLPRNQREFLFALKDRLKIPTERSLNVIVIGGASGIGAWVSSALDLLTASFKYQKPQPNLPDFVLLPGNPANMKFLEAYRIASKYLRQEEIDTLWWELFRVGLTSPPRSPKEAIERINLIMVAINSAAELDRNISKSKVLRATTALSKPIWFGFYRTAIRSF